MFNSGILGGTFDRFHAGHKKLIDVAFSQSRHVTIGLATAPIFKRKFLAEIIEDYKTRELALINYLKLKKFMVRASIIPLNDIYGNSLSQNNIDAIFVTKATAPNARKINIERKKSGFHPLKLIIVPFVKGQDRRIIKSERIRLGEIDRNGNVYMRIFRDKNVLHLPNDLRQVLRNPYGKTFTKSQELNNIIQNSTMIISIGDICSLFLQQAGFHPDISIIDFKTRRHTIEKGKMHSLLLADPNALSLSNKPGTINKDVISAFRQKIKQNLRSKEKQIIIITGEEDLLALPAILLAPLTSTIFYGQFDVGTVAVPVTEEKKQEIVSLLKKFY